MCGVGASSSNSSSEVFHTLGEPSRLQCGSGAACKCDCVASYRGASGAGEVNDCFQRQQPSAYSAPGADLWISAKKPISILEIYIYIHTYIHMHA